MKSMSIASGVAAIVMAATLTGCETWHRMDKTEGTALGAGGGAVAGAVVAGPVGAVVGGVGGAYAGHEVAGKDRTATARSSTTYSSTSSTHYDPTLVRDVQQALNDKGYSAGPTDGQWGPNTEDAVRRFQQTSGLPQTGQLDGTTISALGVGR